MFAATATRLPAAFNRLAWSNLAAQSAEQIGLAAAPIVAVLALGAGEGETGLLQMAQTLPFLLLSFPAGVLADRTSRRRLMATAEGLRVLSLLAILVLILGGSLTMPLLAILGFIGASGTVAYGVAAPSLVPALVARDELAAANARLEVARTTAFIAGPAAAGLVVGWLGAGAAFAFAAALSTLAVLLFLGLEEPPRPKLPPRHFFQDLTEGTRFVVSHTLLRPTVMTAIIYNTSFFMMQAVFVPYAVRSLGMSATAIGVAFAFNGIGLVGGALLAPTIARRITFGAFVTLGPVCGFLASVVMASTLWLPSTWLPALSYFLLGIGPMLWIIGTATLRQSVTPPGMLGRVSAIVITATQGSRPMGAALGALIGGTWGAGPCLVIAAIGFFTQMMLVLFSPLPRLLRQPEPMAQTP